MTRIDVGLMGIYSNYHEHEIDEEKWCKDKQKYKSKNKIQKPKQNLERLTLEKIPPNATNVIGTLCS